MASITTTTKSARQVTIDFDRFDRAMRDAPVELFRNLLKGMKTHHRRFLNHFKRTRMRSSATGEGVQTRSGAFRRSFDMEAGGSHLDDLYATSFSAGAPQARIQEEGGEVKARPGRYLSIPLDAAKTASGVQRKPPRQWNDTFFLRTDDGQLLLMQERGEDEMIPLFAMVKKVTIPGNLGFLSTWKEQMPKFVKMVDRAAADALKPDTGEAVLA